MASKEKLQVHDQMSDSEAVSSLTSWQALHQQIEVMYDNTQFVFWNTIGLKRAIRNCTIEGSEHRDQAMELISQGYAFAAPYIHQGGPDNLMVVEDWVKPLGMIDNHPRVLWPMNAWFWGEYSYKYFGAASIVRKSVRDLEIDAYKFLTHGDGDDGDEDESIAFIRNASSFLSKTNAVACVNPEGGRHGTEKMMPFSTILGKLGNTAGLIMPIVFEDMDEVIHPGANPLWPGNYHPNKKTIMRYLPIIITHEWSQQITDSLKQRGIRVAMKTRQEMLTKLVGLQMALAVSDKYHGIWTGSVEDYRQETGENAIDEHSLETAIQVMLDHDEVIIKDKK